MFRRSWDFPLFFPLNQSIELSVVKSPVMSLSISRCLTVVVLLREDDHNFKTSTAHVGDVFTTASALVWTTDDSVHVCMCTCAKNILCVYKFIHTLYNYVYNNTYIYIYIYITICYLYLHIYIYIFKGCRPCRRPRKRISMAIFCRFFRL